MKILFKKKKVCESHKQYTKLNKKIETRFSKKKKKKKRKMQTHKHNTRNAIQTDT